MLYMLCQFIIMVIYMLWLVVWVCNLGLGMVLIFDFVCIGLLLDVFEDWEFVVWLCLGWLEFIDDMLLLYCVGWQENIVLLWFWCQVVVRCWIRISVFSLIRVSLSYVLMMWLKWWFRQCFISILVEDMIIVVQLMVSVMIMMFMFRKVSDIFIVIVFSEVLMVVVIIVQNDVGVGV